MKKYSQRRLLARKFIPAMFRGGQWFDEIGHVERGKITDAAGKINAPRRSFRAQAKGTNYYIEG
jgi:hypothetical protein